MKIKRIQTNNFVGAINVDVKLSNPVALFAGKNGAGKSSLQEAVRMALTGETVRVELKKEYDKLLSDDGAESGFIAVEWDGGEASVVLPKGDRHLGGNEQISGALPYVLDAQRFARLPDNDRRAFLYGLMGIKMDGDQIRRRLIDRLFGKTPLLDADKARIERIMPILRGGFDAAQSEAAGKAREAKSAWRTVTGETYGDKKAVTWKAESPSFDPTEIAAAEKALADIDTAIEEANRNLGGLQNAASGIAGRSARIAELREKADKKPRIQEKLARDEKELAEWEKKLAEARAKAGVATVDTKAPGQFLLRGLASVTADFIQLSCEFDQVAWPSELLNRAATHLAEYTAQHGDPNAAGEADPEAAAALPNYEKAHTLLKHSVENDKRDLAAAEAAIEALKQLEKDVSDAPSEGAILEAKSKVETLKNDRKGAAQKLADLQANMRKAAEADSKTKKAAEYHADVQAWDRIASALAPDGIPGDILAEALGPINARLHAAAADTQWPQVTIHPDMSITFGKRDYRMLSESEKWRADAMIAEAVSYLSGVKLLVLDRFDMLDLQGREDLLIWLDILAADGEIDSALLFGTLKALPAGLPETVQGVWIENGVAGQIKQAA